MIAPEAGLPASGAFAFLAASLVLRGEFRREKCNMLQKSLAGMVLRVNVGKKKANLEEICSICYIISCIITLISVDSLLKLILK
jgi:hypothetical protein